jgi:hypothetical protein
MASFSLQKKIKFTAFAEKRNQHTQVLWILSLQDLRILATHLKGPEKEDLLQTSLMQESLTSRARTGHHSHKHTGQRGWASRICGSEQISSLDGFNARRALKFD